MLIIIITFIVWINLNYSLIIINGMKGKSVLFLINYSIIINRFIALIKITVVIKSQIIISLFILMEIIFIVFAIIIINQLVSTIVKIITPRFFQHSHYSHHLY